MDNLELVFLREQLKKKENEIQELQSIIGEFRIKYKQTKILLNDMLDKQQLIDQQFEIYPHIGLPEETPA